MRHSLKSSSFLEEVIDLLVRQFGMEAVRATLAKAALRSEERAKPHRESLSRSQKPHPPITRALERIRDIDREKYRLLAEFFARLKERKVLSESQDIRHFAQLVGLKKIGGKSRKDMIPALMNFMLNQPVDRLRLYIERAASISEQQRQQGFSILTDKLLGEK